LSNTSVTVDVVSVIAEQIASGIDEAVGYWLGRIQRELARSSLTPTEQLRAIERIVREYTEVTGRSQFRCAEA
jgi:hypothetical protein